MVLFFTNFGNTVVSYLLRGQTMAEAEGMSGRADMWQFAIRKISERPWTGYGGYAGGRFVVLPGLGMPGKSDVLNTMVESFIDLGVLGVIVLLIVFVGIWWHLFRASRSPHLNSNERHFAVELLLSHEHRYHPFFRGRKYYQPRSARVSDHSGQRGILPPAIEIRSTNHTGVSYLRTGIRGEKLNEKNLHRNCFVADSWPDRNFRAYACCSRRRNFCGWRVRL